MLALNTPELPTCTGLEIGGLCVPWLLIGLALGTLALALVRSLQALGHRARVLDGHNQHPVGFAGIPPRVSLIRLAPLPEHKMRRRARQL